LRQVINGVANNNASKKISINFEVKEPDILIANIGEKELDANRNPLFGTIDYLRIVSRRS
jgi:hypothetical protein